MKIQHWFFFKRHPENIPKVNLVNKKEIKRSKVTKLPMVTNNNEQEVLDACWNESTLGNKLRNKLIKRMERAREMSKSRQPFTRERTNTTIKGMGKRNMSSKILLVQERNKPLGYTTSRTIINPILGSNTPQVNFSFAGRTSAMEQYLSSSKGYKDISSYHTGRDIRARRELSKSSCRDNSVYETLRDQLQKITLKLDKEGISDGLEWRQRRTRKERADRNVNLVYGSSSLVQSQPCLPPKSHRKVAKPNIPQGYHTHRPMTSKAEPIKRPHEVPKPRMKDSKVQTINSQRYKKPPFPLRKQALNTFNSKTTIKNTCKQKENIGVNKGLTKTLY